MLLITSPEDIQNLQDKIMLLRQENEALRKEIMKVFNIVNNMRYHQNKYKHYRATDDKNKAAQWAYRADAYIKEKLREIKSEQGKIF